MITLRGDIAYNQSKAKTKPKEGGVGEFSNLLGKKKIKTNKQKKHFVVFNL